MGYFLRACRCRHATGQQSFHVALRCALIACCLPAVLAQETAIDPVGDQLLNEDAGLRQIALSGILPGEGASSLSLGVSIADDSLAVPSVGPVASDGTALLYLNPLSDAYGSSTVTITATDNLGGSAQTAFLLTVVAVNDAPGLDPIAEVTVDEDSGRFTVPLSGIHSGAANEDQRLTVSALVSDSNLLNTPEVVYQDGDSTGSLLLTPQANAAGSCSVAVIVTDDGGTANGGSDQQIRIFTVTIDDSNDAPTLLRNETITVGQSSSVVISSLELAVSDDDPAGDLRFELTTPPAAGQLERDGSPLALGDAFSQADIDGGLLRYVHGGGALGSDGFACDLRDPEGLGFALSVDIDIVASSTNQPPQLAIGTTDGFYREGDSPVLLTEAALLSDSDGNLGGGRLTVSIDSGAESDDRLVVLNDSSITISGSQVSHLGTPLALLSGGSGSQALIAELDAAASVTGVQALIRRLAFSHLGQNPLSASRQISFVVRDSQNADSAPVSRKLSVEGVNDAPDLNLSRTQMTWFEDDPGLLVDDALLVDDVDSADLALGQLHLVQTSGGQSGDLIDLQAGDRLQVDGDTVLVDGIPIGTWQGGAHPEALVVTFNAFATPPLVQEAMRGLRFTGSDDEPVNSLRSLALAIDDGDGGSTTATLQLSVIAVNDAPSLSAGSPLSSWSEGDGPSLIDATLILSDPDSIDFNGGVIQAALDPAGHVDDRLLVLANADLSIDGDRLLYQGIQIASGNYEAQSLLLSLTADCDLSAATALLHSLAFNNSSHAPGEAQRGLSLRISDGDGGTSNQLAVAFSVEDINTPPTFTPASASAHYIENAAPKRLIPGVSIHDLDHSDLGAGHLRCRLTAGADPTDRLSLVHEGIAIGEIGLSGDLVLDGGTQVGLLTGQNSQDLRIDFDDGVSPELAGRIAARIAFDHDGDNPGAQNRQIELSCSDGQDTGTATVTMTVQPVNDAPQASTHRFAALSRAFGDLTFRYPLTAIDPDGDSLQWTIVEAPQTGSLDLQGNIASYQVGEEALGSDTFIVVASDGQAQSEAVEVQILITDLDDARPHIASDPAPVVRVGDNWRYQPLVDSSDLTRSGETTFTLYGDLPPGLQLHIDEFDITTLRLDAASGPGHYRFGLLFTDTQSGWSGYQPIMLNIIDTPGGDG